MQARTGSSRLPEKIIVPFAQQKSILQLMIENLQTHFPEIPLVVATTTNPADAAIVEQAVVYPGVKTFRGSEANVLERTVEAAQAHGIDRVIRVCSDNPFLHPNFVRALLNAATDADYVSYRVDDLPTIRTHYGLFAERVERSALERALSEDPEPFFCEHVTNYIYGNPERFSCEWLPIGDALNGLEDLRLTIDDPDDFTLATEMYEALVKSPGDFSLSDLNSYLSAHPEVLDHMRKNKAKYTK